MIVREGCAVASDGSRVQIHADTVCLHGDTAGAAKIARAVRDRLESDGVPLSPL